MIEQYRSTNAQGAATMTRVDVDFACETDDAVWMLWIFVKLKHPDPDGLCSDEEQVVLRELEAELTRRLEKRNEAAFAGTRTQEGWIEFYFYTPFTKGADKQIHPVLNDFDYTQMEMGSSRDSGQSFYYLELMPDAYQLQQIKDRAIIAELLEAGDDVSRPRVVEHYLFFQTRSAMQRLAKELAGPDIEIESDVEGDETYAFGLLVRKVHPVDAETVRTECAPLITAAIKAHGYYHGWGTTMG